MMLLAYSLILLSLVQAQSPQRANDIFTSVTPAEFSYYFDSDTAAIQRNVFINTDLFGHNGEFDPAQQAQSIQIELFGNRRVTAYLEDSQQAYERGYTLRYSIPSHEYGMALFSVYNDEVEATIHLDDELYLLHPVGNGQASLELTDQTLNFECGTDDSSASTPPIPGQNNNDDNIRYHEFTIDVMTVYTQEALSHYSNRDAMYALINLAIFEANTAYSLSGAYQRLRLVHIGELFDPEPSDPTLSDTNEWGLVRDALHDVDGVWDEVHSWRDDYGADFVIGITEVLTGGNVVGKAYVMQTLSTSNEVDAFSVVRWSSAAGYHSYTHELGHCMGLRHDSGEVASYTSVNSYCAGHDDGGSYRTLMNKNSGTRVLQLSNPSVDFPNGNPSGVSGVSENALTLNETVPYTAAFRAHVDYGTEISTTYSGSEIWVGHFFDMTPKEDISITQIDQNLAALVGLSIDMELYWREGSYVGVENDISQWNLLDSSSTISAGQGLPSVFPIDGSDISFEAGVTYGIYLDLPLPAGLLVTPTSDIVVHQNDDIRIESGAGRGFGGWGGSAVTNKIWNGTLHYEAAAGDHNADTEWWSTSAQAGGFMVDVLPNIDMRINSFDLNIDHNGDTGSCTVDIYMRTGSFAGNEYDVHEWTFLGSDPLTIAQAVGTPTRVVLSKEFFESPSNNGSFNHLDLNSGVTYSFYFVLSSAQNSAQRFAYYGTAQNEGNSDISILPGIGRNTDVPFNGTVYSPRGWSGGINYTSLEPGPHLELDDFYTTWFGLNSGTIQVSNATPNAEVKIALSINGDGPMTTAYGALALSPPLRILSSIFTDNNGNGVSTISPPSAAQGWQVWLAGLDFSSLILTNGATIVIE